MKQPRPILAQNTQIYPNISHRALAERFLITEFLITEKYWLQKTVTFKTCFKK